MTGSFADGPSGGRRALLKQSAAIGAAAALGPGITGLALAQSDELGAYRVAKNLLDRMDRPVVHASWNDAMAYVEWAAARLPTEAEWECAARGGLEGRRFAWGDELLDESGVPRCNVFRGGFPNAPLPGWQPQPTAARSGAANGYGLFNVCGNVWEWCADTLSDGWRPLRGGSFLCHDSYCNRYRVAARSSNSVDTSTSNIGFRVVKRDP